MALRSTREEIIGDKNNLGLRNYSLSSFPTTLLNLASGQYRLQKIPIRTEIAQPAIIGLVT